MVKLILVIAFFVVVVSRDTQAQTIEQRNIDSLIDKHPILHQMVDSLEYYFNKYKRNRNDTISDLFVKKERRKVKGLLGGYIVTNYQDTVAWHLLYDFTRAYTSSNSSWEQNKLDEVDVNLSIKVHQVYTNAITLNRTCKVINTVYGNTAFLLSRYYSDKKEFYKPYQMLCLADTTASYPSSCADAIPVDENMRYEIKQEIAVKTGIDSIQLPFILRTWLYAQKNYCDTLFKIVRNALHHNPKLHLVADSALKSIRPQFSKTKEAELTGVEFDFLGRTEQLINFNMFGSEEVNMYPFNNPKYQPGISPNQLDIDYYKELFKKSEYYRVLVEK